MVDSNRNTWRNALVGAIATVVLSFTVVSPILGGALAGYLECDDGVRVGAISGVLSVLPLLLFVLVFVGLAPSSGGVPAAIGIVVIVAIFLLFPLYVVTLSALGGHLGVALSARL